MQVLVSTMIGNAAVALGLALLALAAMKLRRPAAAHVLWLLVIVKLLTPWGWRVQVVEESARTASITRESPRLVARAGRMEVPRIETRAAAVAVSAPPARAAIVDSAPVRNVAARSRSFSILSILIGLWIGGSAAWVLVTITRIARFRRLLRTAREPDDHFLDELASVATRMQLTRLPELRLVDAAVSPMLWFLGRRVRLILPRRLVEETSAVHREGVIAHELAHLKRGDHCVRLFEMVATAILWWHPLLWLARRGLREAEEQCCDAWVVALLPHARRDYADALVDALEMVAAPRTGGLSAPAGATGLGHVQHLRRRLTMILTGTGPKSLSRMGKFALVAIAVAVVPLVPVRGEAQARQAGSAARGAATASVAATGATTQPAGAEEATRRAVDALLDRAVQDSDQSVRNAALAAIARFGPRAIPALLDGVKNERTAEFSRNLLAGLGLNSMDALLVALDSPDAQVRKEALRTLTQIVSSAYTSRPEFAGVMQAAMMGGAAVPGPGMGSFVPPGRGFGGYAGPGEMEGGQIFVAGAVAPQIQPGVMPEPVERLIPPVTKAARDEDTDVRRAAVQLMSHLVVVAVPAGRTGELMPVLESAMTDGDADVRADAIQAFQFAGPAAGSATAALTKAVSDENDRVRSSALMALRAIGPAARDATPAVIAALKDPQPPIRALAAETLGALQAPPPPPPPSPGAPVGAEGSDPTGLPVEATTAPAQVLRSGSAPPSPAPGSPGSRGR